MSERLTLRIREIDALSLAVVIGGCISIITTLVFGIEPELKANLSTIIHNLRNLRLSKHKSNSSLIQTQHDEREAENNNLKKKTQGFNDEYGIWWKCVSSA
ncbi:hypothetical protein K440DRAFT_644357 [Wilcoxina mikolae CBS 423.85]|nr:hypothetical protein K440DRAFT_644357 [Wilcoxina mikolae CBS 423.85]